MGVPYANAGMMSNDIEGKGGESKGMFGKIGSVFGFGENSSTGGTGSNNPPDMTVTGEGT